MNFSSLENVSDPSNHSSTFITPYSERVETYIIPVVFAIIFLIGVFGNGTLVLIFIRHRVMRNVPNTYILSLALGDLLVIAVCVPFTSTVYTFESWPYGELICKLSEGAKEVSIGVSVFTLTALSADRFFAIADPLKKLHSSIGGRRATRFTMVVTFSIWLFAFLCALPAFTLSYIRVFKEDNITLFEACYPFPEDWTPFYPKTMIMVKFFMYYAIPLVIIAIFYILMAHHLILSTRNLPGEMQGQARQIKARRKVAKTVLTFVIVFAVCFFPQHMFMIWFYFHPSAQEDYNQFWHIFRIVGFCLSFINSCVNPIALYFVSGAFRKYFDTYLFAWCKKRPVKRRSGSTTPRNSRATRKEKTFWDSTTTPGIHLSTIRKPNHTSNECTVMTQLNGTDKIRN